MENLEILQEKFNQEKEKFKLDMQAWNKFQEELSNELNEKMREIFALKNSILEKLIVFLHTESVILKHE